MLYRWPVQVLTFIALISSAITGTMLYRKSIWMKIYFTFILTWIYHATLFHAVRVVRIICCHGEPGYDRFIIFWASAVSLHAALATLFTFAALLGLRLRFKETQKGDSHG